MTIEESYAMWTTTSNLANIGVRFPAECDFVGIGAIAHFFVMIINDFYMNRILN
ncbi:hypothetical protein [Desulfovibrio inopinatus]|uniref:hypothetical protein n=1 Tax=Desulfovibrio inopinatus TaxID=102109 RepID=UPI0012EC4C22|nr:hypothetical protein [Desulfovibrio inopinatus]